MGLFGKIFGKEEKKESCSCEMEIVESVSYTHLDVYKRQPLWFP